MKHFGADKNCRSLPLAKIIDKYLANVNQIKRYEAGTTQPTLEVLEGLIFKYQAKRWSRISNAN